jgi:hypothetical protein
MASLRPERSTLRRPDLHANPDNAMIGSLSIIIPIAVISIGTAGEKSSPQLRKISTLRAQCQPLSGLRLHQCRRHRRNDKQKKGHLLRKGMENTMSSQNDFPLVFEHLKKMLSPFEKKLTLKADTADSYYLEGPYNEKWKKEIFFGSIQIKKNYVSFYLMPVYMYPDLLDDISPALKKHMQGKSCFNFKKVEPELFNELTNLTKKSFERFNKENRS